MSKKQRRNGLVMVPAWKTADGRVIPIMSMDTSHLQNTIEYLRKRDAVTKEEAGPPPDYPTGWTGEYAQMQAESEWDQAMTRYNQRRVSPALGLMLRELAKRAREQPLEVETRQ